ncbi:/ / hypothetical protein / 589196:589444 Forward [Candidatus Hepatoplasma crinochetorum]|uniref:Uncharacterized protein n=1 Tax=Candidatus Hepatoplasma crinochetorum TaxID=295596 RepID=A0A0G7ZN46_9MOLU|nr:/ / hypothetical protein / 589196:589444 Forward [Candidatus Hepatoplasma crinochetorum]
MKINFISAKKQSENNLIKNELNNLSNKLINLDNRVINLDSKVINLYSKVNSLENRIETKFTLIDHDLNEIKIILKNLEKNRN